MSKRHHNRVHSSSHSSSTMSIGSQENQETQETILPNYMDVQRLAYQIHEEKGGSDLDNWLEAERILKGEHQAV